MQTFLPLVVYCISLLSLRQLSASPAGERPDANRLNHVNEPIGQEKEISPPSDRKSNSVSTSSATKKLQKGLSNVLRHPLASGVRTASPNLTWAQVTGAFQIKRRAKRSRGHANSRRGKNHSRRCALGTCYSQNLGHRLYELIGKNGRKDSSPVDTRSPHSYG